MRLLCFDPGLTIGWCIFEPGEKGMKLEECGHLYDLEDLIRIIDYFDTYNSFSGDVVLNESFARGNSVVKEQIETLRLCGAIEALALDREFTYAQQYPAQRTGYVPIAKKMIKELGFGTLKENHHAIDAIAHGLCYMDNNNIEWQKQWWMKVTFGGGIDGNA